MRKKTLGLTALALAAAVTVPAAPANALGARVCVTTGTATFSPPLTVFLTTGSVTFNYSFTCAGADSSGAAGLQGGGLSVGYTYVGSCVSAVLQEDGAPVSGVLVGSAAGVTFNTTTRPGARAVALLPNLPSIPCNLASATFVNVGPDVLL